MTSRRSPAPVSVPLSLTADFGRVVDAAGLADPAEFMDSLMGEMFDDEVFVFTPQGEVKALPAGATPLARLVYFFGNGHADGTRAMRDVLGGKGANLAEMTNLGVPVPPGFTIACQAGVDFLATGAAPGSRRRGHERGPA